LDAEHHTVSEIEIPDFDPYRGKAEGVRTPVRRPGREAHRRILDAVEELLRQGPWEEISNLDIQNATGMSSSSIYARFESRKAMLEALVDRFTERAEAAARETQEQFLALENPTLDEVIYISMRAQVRFVRENGHIQRTMSSYESLEGRRREFEARIGRYTFEQTTPFIPIEDVAERAARQLFIGLSAAAAIQRAFGPPNYWADRWGFDDEWLAKELTRAITSYLRTPMTGPYPSNRL
jgi:AcrR family transcriptional regulator